MRRVNISEFRKDFNKIVKKLPIIVLKDGKPFLKVLPVGQESGKCEFDDKWLGRCDFKPSNFYKISWFNESGKQSRIKYQWLCPKHVQKAGEEVGTRIVEV